MKFPVFVISLSALIVFIYYPVAGQVEEDITVNPQNNNSYLTTANFFGMKSFITENRFYKGNGLNTLVEKLSANQNPVNKTDSSALALLVFQIGYAEYLEGNNSSANYYYKKAGSLLNSETDDTLITHLYRFRSLLYLGELNFDSSRYYSNRGLTFCKRKNLVAASERFNALLAIADETERSYKLATTDKNHLFPTELILDNQRAVNKTDLIIHNAFYLKHFKEQQALQLEIEKKNSKAKRNLVFFYFLSIAGITFTAAVIFYLRSERNKSLLKKEKESEHLMSRFFVNLSHELRTPITLILGPLEILLSNARSEERKLLNVVQKNGQKMLRLVNHLLDISKIEAGKMEFKASRNDIIPLLSSLYSSFHLYALSKNIKLNYQSKFDKYKLYFNMDMMEKIISNLLSNALKFTSENGSVTLSIKDEWISTTRYLAIEIIDTGMGIQKKDLPKLFNRYYQVGKYKQNTWEGTGIGLSLAKELVELHSGKIEVKSEMCVGTSFKILLPTGKNHLNEDNIYEIEQEYEDKELPIELMDSIVNEEPAQPIDKAKHLVLVIDDNSDMRRYLRQVLSKEYHVIDAPNGKSGIEKVFEYTPDLIVCDLMMPVTDGNQVCERLKADEQTKHIPIIILTAKNNDDDRLTSLQKKADSFLLKPFKAKELLLTVDNLVTLRDELKEVYRSHAMVPEADVSAITSVDKKFLKKVYDVIDDNVSNELFGVEDLSSAIGLSRSQVQRKIKEITRQNPNEVIRNYRLEKSMVMLKNNSGTISEISYQVGFSSPSYFTKCFVKKFNLPPNEVVQNHKPANHMVNK